MDKKSIIGIAVVAVLFLGFAYFNSQQQKEYLEQKAAYEAYVDSVAAAARAAAPVADSLASGNGVQAEVAAAEAAAAVRERQVETLGESLTAAREAEAEEFIVENDVMAVLFSTRGGQIKGVTLKDYTQYGPRGKRDRKIEMMDPATARSSARSSDRTKARNGGGRSQERRDAPSGGGEGLSGVPLPYI